jgi:hypothetical protein
LATFGFNSAVGFILPSIEFLDIPWTEFVELGDDLGRQWDFESFLFDGWDWEAGGGLWGNEELGLELELLLEFEEGLEG